MKRTFEGTADLRSGSSMREDGGVPGELRSGSSVRGVGSDSRADGHTN
jgi:hypothetical protein